MMEMTKWNDWFGTEHILLEGKGDDVFYTIPSRKNEEGESFVAILSYAALADYVKKIKVKTESDKQEQLTLLNSLKIVEQSIGYDDASWLVEKSENLKKLIESTGEKYEEYLSNHESGGLVEITELAFGHIGVDSFKDKFIIYTPEQMRSLWYEQSELNVALIEENRQLKRQLAAVKDFASVIQELADEEEDENHVPMPRLWSRDSMD